MYGRWIERGSGAVFSQQGVAMIPRAVRYTSFMFALLLAGCEKPTPKPPAVDAAAVAQDSALRTTLFAKRTFLDSMITIYRKRAQLTTVTRRGPVPLEIRDGKIIMPNRNVRLQALLEQAQLYEAFSDVRYPHCVFVRLDSAAPQRGFVHVGEGCDIPSHPVDGMLAAAPGVGDWYLYHAR